MRKHTMSSKSKEILDALRLLTTPEKPQNNDPVSSDKSTDNHFDRLLCNKLCLLHQKLTSGTFPNLPCLSALKWQTSSEVGEQSDIRWNYTCVCLHLLLMLQKDMVVASREFQEQMKQHPPSMKTPHQAPPLSPDVLSIEQEKTVLTTLQFVVCLGICPNLDKGVGIPLERRSGFGSLLGGSGLSKISQEEKYARLGLCGRVLATCLQVSSLGALVLSRHLNDLLAVLLQLNHSSASLQSSPCKSNSSDTTVVKNTDSNCDVGTDSQLKQLDTKKIHPENLGDDDPMAPSQEDGQCDLGIGSKCEQLTSENYDKADGKYEQGMGAKCEQPNAASEKKLDTGNGKCDDMLLGELEIRETDQEFGETTVQKLMTRVNPSLLVRELVMLQGGAKPRTNVKVKGMPLPVSPSWLRQVCGHLMTDILMRPQGLLHVLQGMLPSSAGQTGSKPADAGDWRKCQAVAMVIAHCPMQTSSVEEYYKHISPQMLALLHHSDSSMSRHYLRVVVTLIKEMSKQLPRLVQRHLLEPILKPLPQCVNTQNITENSADHVVVTEKDLSLCVQDIHKVYVSCTEAQACVWPLLSHYIPVLFNLYCTCKTGVSHIRTPTEDILVTFLRQADSDISLGFLWLLATGVHDDGVKDIPLCRPHLLFRAGESGGMTCVLTPPDSSDDLLLETRVMSLVELVKHLQDLSVAGDFFIRLLKELTVMVSRESREDTPVLSSLCEKEKELYALEERDGQKVELFNRRLIVLNLLASMCEELDPTCLKKTQQILEFVRATLERGVQVCRSTTEELTGLFESETLSMAMGLLTAVMGGAVQVDETDREAMQELLPLLDEIRQDHYSEEVREMADDLRIAIATRGAVWSELMKNKSDQKKSKPNVQLKATKPAKTSGNISTKPLIEVISETSNMPAGNSSVTAGSCEEKHSSVDLDQSKTILSSSADLESKVNSEKKSDSIPAIRQLHEKHPQFSAAKTVKRPEKDDSPELEQAFLELCDPEIPVRGHGLLRLTRLIQNKDASALSRTETLLKVFEENLQHQDSYLYLASVSGLAALADRCPDEVVPRLAGEFADFDAGPRKKSPELRMKLGESLMKAAKNLGDMIPKYRDILLAAILSGSRSDDPLVRASILSNLAEVCRLLRFSLGTVVHEVFLCCTSVVKTDPDDEARKAAILTITQILQGLGDDTPKVLENVLKDLYRLLKLAHTADTSEMVRTHALLALNELDTIMRNALFPQQKLQKKITVLHPD